MPRNEYPSWTESQDAEQREQPAFPKLATMLGNAQFELEEAFPRLQAAHPDIFGDVSYEELVNLSLEDRETRRKFAERCLSFLAQADDAQDAQGVSLALGLIGGAVHAVAPITENEMPKTEAGEEEPQPVFNKNGLTWGEIPGVDAPTSSNSSYVLLLGSGTSGNRVFFNPEKGRNCFLTFPDGQRVSSPLLQHGFKILFGKRAKFIEKPGLRIAYVPVREAGEAPCPCKKERSDGTPVAYKECHGRPSEGASSREGESAT